MASGRINHIFGTRYRWSVLEDAESYAYVYKYVFRNPVRAGLCKNVEDYRYSSLQYNMRLQFDLPILEHFKELWNLIPKPMPQRLAWLNIPTPKEHEELIKLALRRYTFRFSSQKALRSALRALQANYL